MTSVCPERCRRLPDTCWWICRPIRTSEDTSEGTKRAKCGQKPLHRSTRATGPPAPAPTRRRARLAHPQASHRPRHTLTLSPAPAVQWPWRATGKGGRRPGRTFSPRYEAGAYAQQTRFEMMHNKVRKGRRESHPARFYCPFVATCGRFPDSSRCVVSSRFVQGGRATGPPRRDETNTHPRRAPALNHRTALGWPAQPQDGTGCVSFAGSHSFARFTSPTP
jgi:hypothetical protein